MKYSGAVVALILAAIVITIGVVLGLFELSLMPLLGNALVAGAFAFVGVMLGRRSDSANAYADEIQTKLRRAQSTLREHGIELPR